MSRRQVLIAVGLGLAYLSAPDFFGESDRMTLRFVKR
jgi:predicted methyltransferase